MNDDNRFGGGLDKEERDLLACITTQIELSSAYQHRLARRGRVLRTAALELRLGVSAQVVLARIQEQVPDAVRVMEALTD